jgi:hypothetical protein
MKKYPKLSLAQYGLASQLNEITLRLVEEVAKVFFVQVLGQSAFSAVISITGEHESRAMLAQRMDMLPDLADGYFSLLDMVIS